MASAQVAIVTVAHHSGGVLPQLARDLADQKPPLPLWVIVDNSPEHHPVDILTLGPTVNGLPALPLRLLRGQEGDGFGAGCNRALAWLEAQGWRGWVWLLNPDVALPRGDELRELARRLAELPPRSLVGTAVEDGSGSLEASGGWFTPGLLFRSRRISPRHQGEGSPLPLDWLSGCSLALQPSAHGFQARFDPAFPLYYEDMDLCLRLGRQGAPVLWLSHPRVLHCRGGGSASGSPRRGRLSTVSYLRFLRRHCPAWALGLRTLRLLMVTAIRLPVQPRRSLAVLAGVLEAWQPPAGGEAAP
jgi:N-acetylglucosaminyl-diphospho-decaprenol L-rhamnosyltransferase